VLLQPKTVAVSAQVVVGMTAHDGKNATVSSPWFKISKDKKTNLLAQWKLTSQNVSVYSNHENKLDMPQMRSYDYNAHSDLPTYVQ
jgi:hypothetical protein